MPDTDRLINKDQGDSIIAAIQGITSRLQEMYAVDDALSSTSENPVQNKVVKGALDGKVDKVTGKGLSTNDYTNEEKALVATIPDKADADDVAGTHTISGNPITLTDCAPINAESLVVELEPKQDLHGQDAPYVGGAGKNLFGGVYYDLFPLHFNTNTTITVSADTKGGSGNIQVYYYDENSQRIDYWGLSQSGDRDFKTFEYPSTAYYIAFRQAESTNYQVEVGSVMTPYEPYSNICPITGYTECEVETADSATDPTITNSATIHFGQTVYGGKSNFTDGGTSAEIICIEMDTLSWTYNTSYSHNVFTATLSDSETFEATSKLVCSQYKQSEQNSSSNSSTIGYMSDGDIQIKRSSKQIFVYDSRYTDAATFTTAMDGVQLCYKLATPTQLSTPPTDLKLLQGTNNITTNGTTINLGYQPDNVIGDVKGEIEKCAVDAEFAQFTDGNDTFTDVNLTLDGYSHTVSMVGSKIEQKRFICFEVAEIRSGSVQGIHASCIAFADGAKTPSGTAFRAYIESLQMYVNFRIYGSGGSYTLAYQSETSFSASAFYVRVRMMNNL